MDNFNLELVKYWKAALKRLRRKELEDIFFFGSMIKNSEITNKGMLFSDYAYMKRKLAKEKRAEFVTNFYSK